MSSDCNIKRHRVEIANSVTASYTKAHCKPGSSVHRCMHAPQAGPMQQYFRHVIWFLLFVAYCNGWRLSCTPGEWIVSNNTNATNTSATGWRHGDKVFRWKWHNTTGCPTWKWYTKAELEKCYHNQFILWVGGSTTRELMFETTDFLGLPFGQLERLPCNFEKAQGCFDCVRGCHNKHYWSISKGKDWNDIIMPNHKDSTMKLEFSWKPGMLSLDDLIKYSRLETMSRPPSVIVVHKSVHDAYDYRQYFSNAGVPFNFFLQELQDRAEMLASTLATKFPKAIRIWRDAYYDWTGDVESWYVPMRKSLNPIFERHGFYILSGYNVTKGGILSQDGRHQHISVKHVVNQIIYNLVCNS